MLRGNYSTLTFMAGRTLSGGVAAFRPMQSKTARRNRYLAFSQLASEPSGYRPPATRSLAIKPGAIASYGRGVGTSQGAVSVVKGVSFAAVGTGTSTGAVDVALVVSISATGTGTSTGTVDMRAPVAIAATGTGTSTGAVTATALGHITAVGTGTTTGACALSAIGHMTASATPFTELSPQALADSVWGHNTAAIIQAILRNRTVTDPGTGTITVYDDNNQPLLVADLWQDADGTIAYAGAGAERRDRLVSP